MSDELKNPTSKSSTPFITTTRGVKISVWPNYDEKNSRPGNMLFIYSYYIVIENTGKEMVQLLNRHWLIRDAFGQVDEFDV